MKIRSYFMAARPATLIAAAAPVLIGTKFNFEITQTFDLVLFLCCLGSATSIQIATNYFNDALDFINGADRPDRQGPQRMVASGVISIQQMQVAALSAILIATLLAIPLLLARGWPILAIGIPSLIFAYGYTGAPIKLAHRGLGEIFVILFFGIIAVAGSAFVQSGTFQPQVLLLGLQSGCLAATLISLNNLRDIIEDAASGKRTLAVRFGTNTARFLITLLLILPLLIQLKMPQGLSSIGYIFTTALASLIVFNLWQNKTSNYQQCLFGSALVYVSFTLSYLWQ